MSGRGRGGAFAVGLAIVPAAAATAALSLSLAPFPLVAATFPADGLALAARALALSALFLAPLARGEEARGALATETVGAAALAAGLLAAAALLSGSPAPGAETALATVIVAGAFLLSRVAARRGPAAVRRHVAIAFVAVFAAPFAAYLVEELGAPGARAARLRDVSPLRALPPWDDGPPSWLALALPAALAASLVASRRAGAAAAGVVAAAAAIAAGGAPLRAAEDVPSARILIAAPVRPGEWVALRASGLAWVSIGGGARVATGNGEVALVPVGPAGAGTVRGGREPGGPADASLEGPGDAAPGAIRVGVLGLAGDALPAAPDPLRVARVPFEALAAAGPGVEGLSALDAIVVGAAAAARLGDADRRALERFARSGGVLAAPAGDPLAALDAGLGRAIAVDGAEAALRAAAEAADLARRGGSLAPGAVDPALAIPALDWRGDAERAGARTLAAVAWVSALVLVLFLATRFARGLSLAAGAILLGAAIAGAGALLAPGDGATGAAARVAFARADGGPARVERWLALAPVGRSPARFEAANPTADAPRWREVAAAPASAPGVEAVLPFGALRVDVAPGATRVFVAESVEAVEGAVVLAGNGGTLRNSTSAPLFDVIVVRDGVVSARSAEVPAGAERPLDRGAGDGSPPPVARWLAERAARAAATGTFVIARRALDAAEPAPGGDEGRVLRATWEWLVLRVE